MSEQTLDIADLPDFAATLAEDDTPAPTPEASPAPETALPEVPDRGDGRDANGRFVAKAGEVAPPVPDAPASAVAAPPSPDTPPASAAPVSPEATPVADPVSPFRVRYSQQEHEPLPGAVRTPHGVVVPLEQEQALHQLVGRALKYQERETEWRETTIRARQAEASALAREKAVSGELDRMFQIAGIPDEEQRAIEAVRFFMELGMARPALEREIALNKREAELELQREMSRPDPDASREQITQQVVGTAEQHIAAAVQQLGLTDEDVQVLKARVAESPQTYAYRAGKNLTADEREAGVKPGELVFDYAPLARDLQMLGQYRRRIIDSGRASQEAIKAAQENARKAAAAAPPPPPAAKPDAPRPAEKKTKDTSTYETFADELKKSFQDALKD